ncbi:hypothetical protein JAAARDRAFT_91666, partial [Jaapia argillacea MUCL 33604]
MLDDSVVPKSLWGEAVNHATWLKNQTSTKALEGMTLFEALASGKPDLKGLQAWDSAVWVHDGKAGSKLN